MSPAIRLGESSTPPDAAPPKRSPRLHRARVAVGGVATRAIASHGEGAPVVLLHGWMDSADTWLDLLCELAERGRPGIAYDLPGFGVTDPLPRDGGTVLDHWEDFAAAAIGQAAAEAGREVVVAGNSLGGWVALRLATRSDLPLAGVVPIAPAGFEMAPFFFTVDRIPAVSRLIGMPAPVPPAVIRSMVARFYRSLAFGDPGGAEQAVVDRFTSHNADRAKLRARIDYVKALRAQLDDPLGGKRVRVPVCALWGDRDRLCMPAGAERLAELVGHARIELLDGIGHTPQIECPGRVIAAIDAIAR